MKVRVEYGACGGTLGKYRSGQGAFSMVVACGASESVYGRGIDDGVWWECRRRAIKNTGCHNAVIEWIEIEEIPE